MPRIAATAARHLWLSAMRHPLPWHKLNADKKPRRRQMIACMYTTDRVVPGMEIAAQRIAKLVDLPYEGYCE